MSNSSQRPPPEAHPDAGLRAEPPDGRLPSTVLIRDALIFHVKLWLDGLKDVVLAPFSLFATLFDLVLGPRSRGRGYRLYAVLRTGERFDLWLNLFGAAKVAESSGEGLFGGSEPGDDTLVGALEGVAHHARLPRGAAE